MKNWKEIKNIKRDGEGLERGECFAPSPPLRGRHRLKPEIPNKTPHKHKKIWMLPYTFRHFCKMANFKKHAKSNLVRTVNRQPRRACRDGSRTHNINALRRVTVKLIIFDEI